MSAEMATHVMVGFSSGLMADLGALLPESSLLVVEEPDVVSARRVLARCREHPCFAGLIEAPIHDEPGPASAAALLAAVPEPAGARVVIPGVEYGVAAAAVLAENWGLPGAGAEAGAILRDKARLRASAGQAGIAQPAWRLVSGADGVAAAHADFGGHCVVKPAGRQGSLGVVLLGPGDDIAAAWSHATGVDEPTMRARRALPERYLAEQRLFGPEVSVECLVSRGRAVFRNITAKSVQDGPYPVENGHTVPAPVNADVSGRLSAAMDQLIAAIGFGSGMLHAEWILADGRPHLIECAGRIPGDSIDTLIDLAYGGRVVADLLAILAGEPGPPERQPGRGAAIRYLASAPGTVRSVDGAELVRTLEGVHELQLGLEPGDTVAATVSSMERAGAVIAVAAGPEAAAARALAAAATVEITLREDPPAARPPRPLRILAMQAPGAVAPVEHWLHEAAPDAEILILSARDTVRTGDSLRPGTRRVLVGDYESGQARAELFRLCQAWQPDRIFCNSEDDVLRAAEARALFGIPGQQPGAARLFRDKVAMKRLFSGLSLEPVPCLEVTDTGSLLEGVREFGHCVLKPRQGAAAVGVHVLRDEAAARAAIIARPDLSGLLNDGALMLEPFISSESFHIDVIIRERLPALISVSRYLAPPHEFAERNPGSVMIDESGPDHALLTAYVHELCAALPPAHGADVLHLEVYKTARGEFLPGEVACRVGGGLIRDGIRHTFGVDITHTSFLLACGLPAAQLPPPGTQARRTGPLTGFLIATAASVRVPEPRPRWLLSGGAPDGGTWHLGENSVDGAKFLVAGRDEAELTGRIRSLSPVPPARA